ncbi:MAG: hypothetical protein GX025_10820 [Clostridiales bacterium]|nr:hypothetical protein [Clostridiales bacterium]
MSSLAATQDIQTVVEWVKQHEERGGARIAPEVFYSKQLLDTIRETEDQYLYFRYADQMPIQDRADKLYLRRWSALNAHTVPLTEGVPPKSDKGSVKKYELEAFQYGRYMEFTDKVSFKVVDPVIAHYTQEYSIVAVETLDLLARDALKLNAQRYFAGGALSFDDLDFTNAVPNMTDLRKIVLSMKRALVKPRSNGRYHVIGSPEFFFDMIDDPVVKAYMTINQTTQTMYDNSMLVPLFGMEFYETLVVPASGEYVDSNGKKRLKYYTGTLDNPTISTSTGATADLDEDTNLVDVEGSYTKSPLTGEDASYIPGLKEWNLSADQKEFIAHHIFVLGKDALARTGLQGEDSAKVYVKPLGSAGVLDPIDQRQSIGFKINSVGFGSVRPEAIVDYICVPTMANL